MTRPRSFCDRLLRNPTTGITGCRARCERGLPRFFAHYVLLTSVFEIKRTGFNDAVGAIHCMLEETIERFGVIIAIDRVVDVVVREGEPLLFFRGAYR